MHKLFYSKKRYNEMFDFLTTQNEIKNSRILDLQESIESMEILFDKLVDEKTRVEIERNLLLNEKISLKKEVKSLKTKNTILNKKIGE